jgi:hypothetical protein
VTLLVPFFNPKASSQTIFIPFHVAALNSLDILSLVNDFFSAARQLCQRASCPMHTRRRSPPAALPTCLIKKANLDIVILS